MNPQPATLRPRPPSTPTSRAGRDHGQPARPAAGPRNDQSITAVIPAPWHPWWRAFMSGYESGIAAGIEIGRAQVEAEEWPVWRQFLEDTQYLGRRPGPLGYTERQEWLKQRARAACQHPDMTMEQIIEHAHRSWGLRPPVRTSSHTPHRTSDQPTPLSPPAREHP